MNYILYDDNSWSNLLPLTFTRPVSELRVGILTLREKWEKLLNSKLSYITQNYLQDKFLRKIEEENILINSSVLPSNEIVGKIQQLKLNECLVFNNQFVACYISDKILPNFSINILTNFKILDLTACRFIKYPWDIFLHNQNEIAADFQLITKWRKTASISETNQYFNKERIFIEDGAKVECAILNPQEGYIYVGKNAEIMEGSIVRGSLAMCEGAVLKLGAKIYGATTLGPFAKVGGEVNNSVIFGYSNKAHDGFLGNAVLGEWCNLGADTNNSNLKNNYSEVKVWNYKQDKFIHTGLQFCGLFMGDHSKTGINTMFNTGSVVGVSANIFGAGFPRSFIPSFSWGGPSGIQEYKLKDAIETATMVMKRRKIEMSEIDKNIFLHIYNNTLKYRSF